MGDGFTMRAIRAAPRFPQGTAPGLVRVSVGLEDAADLRAHGPSLRADMRPALVDERHALAAARARFDLTATTTSPAVAEVTATTTAATRAAATTPATA